MNLIDVAKAITIIPELVRDTLGFAQWNAGQLMGALDGEDVDAEDDDELDPEDVEAMAPLPMHAAGRIALELVMITRNAQGEPKAFRKMVHGVLPDMDSPQHAMDVMMALSSMVAVLAEDDDLERFGQSILHHEASQ